MRLEMFHALTECSPPFASVTLDVSRVDRASEDDVERRWRAVADELRALGAPQETVAAVGERALADTGRGGEWTRVVVAAGTPPTVHDVVVPGRPAREDARWGPVPDLLPAVRGLAGAVPHAVVRIDRTGADIELTGSADGGAPQGEAHEVVSGGHDVVHKVPAGGWSQRRYQMRAEDSWERNAEAVAEALERMVRAQHPDLVLVMGDVRAVALLERHAAPVLAERLVRLDTGGRAPGTSTAAEEEAVAEALAMHRATREAAVVDRFREQLSRQQAAVDGLDDVLDVLGRGQADEVLLVDDPGASATVTVDRATGAVHGRSAAVPAPEPVGGAGQGGAGQVGARQGGGRQARVADVVKVPAGTAVVWRAVRTRAAVTLVDPHQVELRDGVGALLRWSDEATPHAHAPAMPGHGQPPGETANQV